MAKTLEFRCQYVNAHGERCANAASLRLQFEDEHPFDFVEVCQEHFCEYAYWKWSQKLETEEE